MMGRLEKLKLITEVVTPWVSVAVVAFAGVFALVEYSEYKKNTRVARSVAYAQRLNDARIGEPHLRFLDLYHREISSIAIVVESSRTRVDKTAGYYRLIVRAIKKEDGLHSDFRRVSRFYEEAAVCATANLCDEDAIRSLLGSEGRSFFRNFAPYICELRRVWRDPSFADTMESFFNPNAYGRVCKQYWEALQHTGQPLAAS